MQWPRKLDLFGVQVSATSYDEALQCVLEAAWTGTPAIVDHMPVHGLMEASRRPGLRAMLNDFDIVAPDGQPVRWALNRFHDAGLEDRVYGPEMMLRLCRRAAGLGLGIYLYGGRPDVVEDLKASLLRAVPSLLVSGCESPPFRPLDPEEDAQVVDRINASGARIVFLGLGCPKQEIFAHTHRRSIRPVMLCVGAAFDFLSGAKKTAPPWMQRNSLEWLFRLSQEPGRLWLRYVTTNSAFCAKAALAMVSRGARLRAGP